MEGAKRPAEGTEEKAAPRTRDTLMAGNIIGAHGFEHMYSHGFLVLIPRIFDSLGLANYQVGLLEAVRQLSGGLTSTGGGFFVDMFQHRRGQILALSMALLAVGYLVVAISPTYALILVALVPAGAGSALWHPPALGLLSQRFPERRGLLISQHRSTGNIGDWGAPLIIGALLAVLTWRWILAGSTLPIILIAILILVFMRHVGGPIAGPATFRANLKAQLRTLREALDGRGMRDIGTIFAVSALRGMGDRSLLWILALYLSKDLGKSDFWVGFHIALLAAPGIISGPLFGALSDRIGRKSITVFIMGVSVMLPLAMVMGGGGIWMTLSVAGFGVVMFSVNSLTQAAAIDVVAGKRLEATFIGLMWGSNALFGAIAAVISGVLADVSGRETAFYFASALFFVGFLASLAMPSTSSRRPLMSSGRGRS